MRCKAKAKSTGKQCNRFAVTGREVCQVHGGKTPRGLASPHYKHGKTSRWDKILPAKLTESFNAHVNDPQLRSLRNEIAINKARQDELLSELGEHVTGGTWANLVRLRADFYRAQADKDIAALTEATTEIMRLIDSGSGMADKWRELMGVQEHIRKLTETEWKSIQAAGRVLTMEQAVQLFAAMRASIIKSVPDPRHQQAAIDAMRELVNASGVLGNGDGDSD